MGLYDDLVPATLRGGGASSIVDGGENPIASCSSQAS